MPRLLAVSQEFHDQDVFGFVSLCSEKSLQIYTKCNIKNNFNLPQCQQLKSDKPFEKKIKLIHHTESTFVLEHDFL